MPKRRALPLFVLAGAAAASVLAAFAIVDEVEERTLRDVESVLIASDAEFAQAEVDGLQVVLRGTAPDEATRFDTISAVGRILSPDRLVDAMDVAPQAEIEPPTLSLELLRNSDGLSAIGLVPADAPGGPLDARLARIAPVTNMIETVATDIPGRWPDAIDFAVDIAADLPRSKISVTARAIHVSALVDSQDAKTALETRLRQTAPAGIPLTLDISAPRPALTPFLLRFAKTENRTAFDACSADTEAARARILAAAAEAGAPRDQDCVLGIGAPSPRWGEAGVLAIRAVASLGGGTVTISDADVTLVALENTDRALFDRVVGELDADLPPAFSLTARLPRPTAPQPGIFEPQSLRFVGTRSPEGLVQLRGHVSDEVRKEVTATLAEALFGASNVYAATTVADAVPEGWSVRVLAGLEALGHLHNGSLSVTPDSLRLSGRVAHEHGPSEVASLLATRLPDEADLRLDIRYDPILDPAKAPPTEEECFARIELALGGEKITFDPGSTKLAPDAEAIIDRIAEVLAECTHVPIEIAGHTDSEGREIMNLNLSQARADAVLSALSERRILTSNLVAKGYGEAVPIASNDTPEGRELNRRIAFTPPTPPVRTPDTADAEDTPE